MQEILSRDTLTAQDRAEIERILGKDKGSRTDEETSVLKARFAYLTASERKEIEEEKEEVKKEEVKKEEVKKTSVSKKSSKK